MKTRKTTDRIAAEQLGQMALTFPRVIGLCDQMCMDAAIRKQPKSIEEKEHAAMLAAKGMYVTEPSRRQA